jgi:predicted HAD superfamily Cof-like phosphohydrolase
MQSMTFVKIQLGDIVFDKVQKVDGKVQFINYQNNTAKVEVIVNQDKENGTRTTKLVESKLFNLTIIEKSKKFKPDPNKWWSMVKDFHKAFSHPTEEKPKQMELQRATSRAVWTGEEALVEFLHASSRNQSDFDLAFTQMVDGLYKAKTKSDAMEYYKDGVERVVAQSDALTDAMYFILGSFVEMGVKPDRLFEAVQNSNMSKLFNENGQKVAKYREEDGKIMKSPDFFAPEPFLVKEIERQLK